MKIELEIKTELNKLKAELGKLIALILSLIISPIISGFVITKLWLWFVVSTFEMQPLMLVEAIGLMLIVNYAKANKKDFKLEPHNKDKFWAEFGEKFSLIIAVASFALLSGWIINMFM